MNIGQALAEGAQTTVIGLGTVFAVLIILMIVLHIMKVIFYKNPQKAIKAETPVPEASETAAEEMNDEELIAVLTAAVAASLNTSTYNLKIKSYRRIDGIKSVWQKTGITETINGRF